jgi:hypothetical protein
MREQEFRVSQREVHRIHVVRLTMEGRETVGGGAKLLGNSVRKRLRRKMKERGDEGLLHGNRGRAPWNKTAAEKIKQVLLARGCYRGLNDTHLTEKLKETSLQAHGGRDTPKLESKCANSSTAAGVCTIKTNYSWRQRLLICKHR